MQNIVYVSGLFQNCFYVESHMHKTYELVYYTFGDGVVEIGGETVPFHKGTFTLVEPEILHSDRAVRGFQNLHLNVVNPGIPVKKYLVLEDNENRDILRIFQNIHYEYHFRRSNCEDLIDTLYQVLYQYMISLMEPEEQSIYTRQLIREMLGNISNPYYQVSEFIKNTPFNANYFRELFAKETGFAPTKYLIYKRMEYAKELIKTKLLSGYSFQEIARLCGYEDAGYFSRLFKKHTGESPRNWYRRNVCRTFSGLVPAEKPTKPCWEKEENLR